MAPSSPDLHKPARKRFQKPAMASSPQASSRSLFSSSSSSREVLPASSSRHPTSPGMKARSVEVVEAESMWESMPGLREVDVIDAVDLPQANEDNNWLHRLSSEETYVEAGSESDGEEEKVCLDRSLPSTASTLHFSKVYEIAYANRGLAVNMPRGYHPVKGSPSAIVKSNPVILQRALDSTYRLKTTFIDSKGTQRIVVGSCFAVSPVIVLSARHCVLKKDMTVQKIQGCGGNHVKINTFDGLSSWEANLVASSGPWSTIKDKEGLFVAGADVAVLALNNNQHQFSTFLLPCSPTYISNKDQQKVAMISYPCVDSFMKQAEDHLITNAKICTPTWALYEPAMSMVLLELIQHTALDLQLTENQVRSSPKIMSDILAQLKKILYDGLQNLFGSFSSGSMVCSVGENQSKTDVAIGITCSTLRGSSGAAVLPLSMAGYFWGVFFGGSYGHDLNIATSTDNKEFVSLYMSNALDTLPDPQSDFWKDTDLQGFLHWLEIHSKNIPVNSAWKHKVDQYLLPSQQGA